MTSQLIHVELTGKIRQIAFDIHNYFGDGFLEKIYQNALVHRLRKAGIKVEQHVPVRVRDEDGTIVGEYFTDLLVEGVVIIEVKAVKAIAPEHEAQLIHYLKATGYRLGLLINFGAQKLEFKRLIYSHSDRGNLPM